MSKWIDKDVKKIIEKQIENVQQARKELTDEEIEEIIPEFLDFFKKHRNDNEPFQDKKGGFIIVVKVPKGAEPKKVNSQFTEEDQYLIFCNSRFSSMKVFGSKTFWMKTNKPDVPYVVRGKLNIQYDIAGTWGTGTYKDSEGNEHKKLSARKYFKTLEKACETLGFNIDDLDEDDIIKSYTLNAWQNLG